MLYPQEGHQFRYLREGHPRFLLRHSNLSKQLLSNPLHLRSPHVSFYVEDGLPLDLEALGLADGTVGEGPWPVYGPDGSLLAVYEPHGGRARPVMVLAPAGS